MVEKQHNKQETAVLEKRKAEPRAIIKYFRQNKILGRITMFWRNGRASRQENTIPCIPDKATRQL